MLEGNDIGLRNKIEIEMLAGSQSYMILIRDFSIKIRFAKV